MTYNIQTEKRSDRILVDLAPKKNGRDGASQSRRVPIRCWRPYPARAEACSNFWQADDFDAIEVNGADWAGVAKGVLNAYKDRLELTTYEKEIISGISLVDIPGHTPGHAGFRVDSDNESLLHLGDIMHFQNLFFYSTELHDK